MVRCAATLREQARRRAFPIVRARSLVGAWAVGGHNTGREGRRIGRHRRRARDAASHATSLPRDPHWQGIGSRFVASNVRGWDPRGYDCPQLGAVGVCAGRGGCRGQEALRARGGGSASHPRADAASACAPPRANTPPCAPPCANACAPPHPCPRASLHAVTAVPQRVARAMPWQFARFELEPDRISYNALLSAHARATGGALPVQMKQIMDEMAQVSSRDRDGQRGAGPVPAPVPPVPVPWRCCRCLLCAHLSWHGM